MRLDLLAIAAHPDDAELTCGGTLALAVKQGYQVGILDLVAGEAGTHGSAELRAKEAERAAESHGGMLPGRLAPRQPIPHVTSMGRDAPQAVMPSPAPPPDGSLQAALDHFAVPGTLGHREGGDVRCVACGHRCLIRPGRRGICKVRYNADGVLMVPRGWVAGVQVDPVEKKPFYHLLPGTGCLTFGMLGCERAKFLIGRHQMRLQFFLQLLHFNGLLKGLSALAHHDNIMNQTS